MLLAPQETPIFLFQPFTQECWLGLVWKLKERIEALEGVVGEFI